MTALPCGTAWPTTDRLRERLVNPRGEFAACVSELNLCESETYVVRELLTSHSAAQVSGEGHEGLVLGSRRPDVVLTVEAEGTLWIKASWFCSAVGALS